MNLVWIDKKVLLLMIVLIKAIEVNLKFCILRTIVYLELVIILHAKKNLIANIVF